MIEIEHDKTIKVLRMNTTGSVGFTLWKILGFVEGCYHRAYIDPLSNELRIIRDPIKIPLESDFEKDVYKRICKLDPVSLVDLLTDLNMTREEILKTRVIRNLSAKGHIKYTLGNIQLIKNNPVPRRI